MPSSVTAVQPSNPSCFSAGHNLAIVLIQSSLTRGAPSKSSRSRNLPHFRKRFLSPGSAYRGTLHLAETSTVPEKAACIVNAFSFSRMRLGSGSPGRQVRSRTGMTFPYLSIFGGGPLAQLVNPRSPSKGESTMTTSSSCRQFASASPNLSSSLLHKDTSRTLIVSFTLSRNGPNPRELTL